MPTTQTVLTHPLWAINVAASLKRDDGVSGPMYRGHLCGTLAERVVILEGSEPLPFVQGDRVLVHTNLRGQAIGFVATVIGQENDPAPHYFLSFPDEYEELDLRKSARVPALLPVRIEMGGEPQVVQGQDGVEGVLINVSQSGCALASLEAFGPNANLTLSITLPGRPGEYRLDVTVVSRQDTLPLHVHGARFVPGTQARESLRSLQDWIVHQRSFWPNAGVAPRRAM